MTKPQLWPSLADPLHTRAITLAPALTEVARLNTWFAKATEALDPVVQADMKLCLNEAIANVISHGIQNPETSEITLDLTISENTITALLVDNGIPFDPASAPIADPLSDLESAEIGGFGIKLIRETATSLTYHRDANKNRLTIICSRD